MLQSTPMNQDLKELPDSLEIATLGAGCFWCVEAIFQDLKGVLKVESGYSGGTIKILHIAKFALEQQGMLKCVRYILTQNKFRLKTSWRFSGPPMIRLH